MQTIYINDGWEFVRDFSSAFINGDDCSEAETVRIPHTCAEIPYNYADERLYQTVCGYRRELDYTPEWEGRRVFVTFEGAAHVATVYFNGHELTTHRCGYTAFSVEMTGLIGQSSRNLLAVRLDSRESCNVPPFGNVIDYLCYGGIYREVRLDVTAGRPFIADAFPMTQRGKKGAWRLDTELVVAGNDSLSSDAVLCQTVRTPDGEVIASAEQSFISCAVSTRAFPAGLPVSESECRRAVAVMDNLPVRTWSVDSPSLYEVEYELSDGGIMLDRKTVRVGFRQAEFRADGFYLNGEKIKLRGLNRHQSYPYVGYAMPESMQRYDADILKFELGVNIVRTSHYPQSRHFIDRCDELGLLVFTEIPGWQYVGDDEWQEVVISNTAEMVTQYRAHPSVILWGVRVNESQDHDELYASTNAVAHELDPTRQTSGVRYLEHSSLLEDVYAHNDFSYSGGALPALKDKSKVVPDKKRKGNEKEAYEKLRIKAANGRKLLDNADKGYIVSECNGHMFPTKAFDDEAHRFEHAKRHAAVLESMYAKRDIAGCISWCMFDYNTHQDFGSGDKICYHGVLDMFRNPKLAASVYTSQSESVPTCEMNVSMEIGEHPGGNLGDIYVYTNADSVRLYKNGEFVSEFKGDRKSYPSLPHPPVHIDDMIGGLIEKNEDFRPRVARQVKKCLADFARCGMDNLPLRTKLRVAKLMAFNGFTFAKGYELFGKYVANWGGVAAGYRIEAIKDGRVMKTVERRQTNGVIVNVIPSHTELVEGSTYDVALVRIRIEDGLGNRRTYFSEPVTLYACGAIELIGPEVVSMKGGAFGAYVRTTGNAGRGRLVISGAQIPETAVEFSVTVK